MFKKILLLLFFCCFSINSFSQDNKIQSREIPSITDWIEEINNWPDSIYHVKNIKIFIDKKKDSLFIQEAFKRNDTIKEKVTAEINKTITIEGFEFDNFFGTSGAVAIKNIHFKEKVRISNYQGIGFAFTKMVFDKDFMVKGSNRYVYYNLSNCIFKAIVGFFDFNNGASIHFINSSINESMQLTRTPGKPELSITNSTIKRLIFPSGEVRELFIRNSNINNASLQNAVVESAFPVFGSIKTVSTPELESITGDCLPNLSAKTIPT